MLAWLERQQTFKALDLHHKKAIHLKDFHPEQDRLVIFSDAHMGDRRPTIDEFQHNETALCQAMQYYLDKDFGLVINGDMEENWKNRPQDIVDAYRDSVYAKESDFARLGPERHLRIWGNHDDIWKHSRNVRRHLDRALGTRVNVHPAVVLGKHIMIAHGHQGQPDAYQFARFSRLVIRHLWRHIQGKLHLERDVCGLLNMAWKKREHYLHAWASSRKMMLIAGHTHRPMFHDFSLPAYFRELHQNLSEQLAMIADPYIRGLTDTALVHLDRLIESAGLSTGSAESGGDSRSRITPNYLNSGSCLSHNGITGIELDQGEIRLVRWQNHTRQIERQASLGRMLASL